MNYTTNEVPVKEAKMNYTTNEVPPKEEIKEESLKEISDKADDSLKRSFEVAYQIFRNLYGEKVDIPTIPPQGETECLRDSLREHATISYALLMLLQNIRERIC